eukprot:TRINITY_DN39709_c0_g1_i1.p1 TRINITY_DN39709_c0_g1~~TRINITY_DN39709_c0_g1_i1.p1  ORF type:complete len:427 (+),score=53.21 TRINITY_DN39709_c0_g1_i1:101-1381(+)
MDAFISLDDDLAFQEIRGMRTHIVPAHRDRCMDLSHLHLDPLLDPARNLNGPRDEDRHQSIRDAAANAVASLSGLYYENRHDIVGDVNHHSLRSVSSGIAAKLGRRFPLSSVDSMWAQENPVDCASSTQSPLTAGFASQSQTTRATSLHETKTADGSASPFQRVVSFKERMEGESSNSGDGISSDSCDSKPSHPSASLNEQNSTSSVGDAIRNDDMSVRSMRAMPTAYRDEVARKPSDQAGLTYEEHSTHIRSMPGRYDDDPEDSTSYHEEVMSHMLDGEGVVDHHGCMRLACASVHHRLETMFAHNEKMQKARLRADTTASSVEDLKERLEVVEQMVVEEKIRMKKPPADLPLSGAIEKMASACLYARKDVHHMVSKQKTQRTQVAMLREECDEWQSKSHAMLDQLHTNQGLGFVGKSRKQRVVA